MRARRVLVAGVEKMRSEGGLISTICDIISGVML